MSRSRSMGIIPLLLIVIPTIGSAGTISIGYEFGRMAFNEFRHFAGEIGYRSDNRHALRIAFFNVALSERHLSSSEASAVEGDDVEGLWRGVDLFYDYPASKNVFISPSVGYHDNKYTHTILGESVRHASPSVGLAFTYLGDEVFGMEQLYWRFSLSFGYNLEEQGESRLGDSIVRGDTFGITPAIYVGYEIE